MATASTFIVRWTVCSQCSGYTIHFSAHRKCFRSKSFIQRIFLYEFSGSLMSFISPMQYACRHICRSFLFSFSFFFFFFQHLIRILSKLLVAILHSPTLAQHTHNCAIWICKLRLWNPLIYIMNFWKIVWVGSFPHLK